MATDRQILLLLDATSPYERKIVQGVATYGYEIGNWDFHFVQDPPGNLPYLDQDPFENPPDLRHLAGRRNHCRVSQPKSGHNRQ